MMVASALPSGNIQSWQNAGLFVGAGLALVGPSGGHFYTGHIGRGLAFSAGRLLLLALGSAAFSEGMRHDDVSEASYDRGAVKTSNIEVALCGVGILALSIWESIDTYFSAKALSRTPKPGLAFAPMIVRGREGLSLIGLSLAGMH